MFKVIIFTFSDKSFCLDLLGYDNMYLFELYFSDGTIDFDFLYLRRPIKWLIKKIKELIEKLKG